MERFYHENAALYQTMVARLKPPPPSRAVKVATETPSPDIIVSARIRPLLNEDVDAGFPCAVFPRAAETGRVDVHDLYNHPKGRPILKVGPILSHCWLLPNRGLCQSVAYQVDRLFNAEATTEEVYEGLVEDLLPTAWHGGFGTLFAYGQTGSGKTTTVSGLEQLIAEKLMDQSSDGQRQLYMTIIDLAGNSAYDLLNSREPISILQDSFGDTQLAGVTEHPVQDRDEVTGLIERAASFRRTAPTFKNDASSRSHGICRIRMKNPTTDTDGLLYLVDLAGSEAARDVAVHGADRMRETREINMSLSVLKDCIRGKAKSAALALSDGSKSKQRKPHIPFRQSALTRVLKHVFDTAGGRACKTVVVACINPSLADVGPSKNTLRYAEMLRVLVPMPKNKDTKAVSIPETLSSSAGDSVDTDTVPRRLGLPGNPSSRDLDPTRTSVSFKERIRPGMVVSWKQSTGRDLALDTPDEPNLAAVLCPAEMARDTTLGVIPKSTLVELICARTRTWRELARAR
ncbi:Uu.00g024740.m01.CDS01 [Anthostomella pinea]|uniref:Uu.00g024740.m01.CDS01 n=1 Tax=Anthostomella pinea TaxID=933095 RepID=A0AAI8YCC6_9PEZI|nr:Uu.00g024740.m01.CDS01 [Anthostomella pinea]